MLRGVLVTVAVAALMGICADASARMVYDANKRAWVSTVTPERDKLEAVYTRAVSLARQGKYDQAMELLERIEKEVRATDLMARIVYRKGECLYHLDRLAEAWGVFEELAQGHPNNPFAEEATRLEIAIAKAYLDGRKIKVFGMTLWASPDFGHRVLRKVVDRNPYGPLADDALLMQSQYYMKSGRLDSARQTLEFLLKNYPSSPLYTQAQYLRGRSLFLANRGANYDIGLLREAHDAYALFTRDNPDSEHIPQVREDLSTIRLRLAEKHYIVGCYYAKKGLARAAARSFRKLINEYGGSTWADAARKELEQLAPALIDKPAKEKTQ